MTRTCPVNGCEERIDSGMLMCRPHWFSVPKPLRDEVWRTYKRFGVLADEYVEARESAIAIASEKASA